MIDLFKQFVKNKLPYQEWVNKKKEDLMDKYYKRFLAYIQNVIERTGEYEVIFINPYYIELYDAWWAPEKHLVHQYIQKFLDKYRNEHPGAEYLILEAPSGQEYQLSLVNYNGTKLPWE